MSTKLKYKISFWFVNISITDSFELTPSITLQSLTSSELLVKYDPNLVQMKTMEQEHIHKHTVEVVFDRTGTMADYKQDTSIEGMHALHRLVTDAILLGMPYKTTIPYAIQALVEPPKSSMREKLVTLRHVGAFTYYPTPLSTPQINRFMSMYGILERSQKDRILAVAVDRFIIGKQGDLHHTRRINESNWDKVVDYVIGLESIFLTVNGNSIKQELSYRFRLNGSTLLAACTPRDRDVLFNALKLLYNIRSRVVHGSPEKKIQKEVERLIQVLDIDETENKHPVGRLDITCRQLDEWSNIILGYLDNIDREQRPYRAEGAWENLLWH